MNLIEIPVAYKKRAYKRVLVYLIPLKSLTLILYQVLLLWV